MSNDLIYLIAKFVDAIKYRQGPKKPISMDMFKLNCISNGVASNHRFILTQNNNELYAAGSNKYYQLGIKDEFIRERYFRFTEVDYFTNEEIKLKQIESGHTYSTFLTQSGEVYVCGFQRNGGLGLDVSSDFICRQITKNECITRKIVEIACGHGHTLLLTEDYTVASYGWNIFGQLGHGTTYFCPQPIMIDYFIQHDIKIVAMSVGYSHNVLLDKDGKMYCFGYNSGYECGNGDFTSVSIPQLNKTLKHMEVVNVKCGYYHNVARTKNNEYYLWGCNNFNQCLMFGENYVKYPTKYDYCKDFDSAEYDFIAIYPGFCETRIVVEPNCVSD
eukprot:354336_1